MRDALVHVQKISLDGGNCWEAQFRPIMHCETLAHTSLLPKNKTESFNQSVRVQLNLTEQLEISLSIYFYELRA